MYTKFRFILIDLIGFGTSSRPENYDIHGFTPGEAIDYFVKDLEMWRKKMKLNDFFMTGHSYGAYLAGNYASKYPQYIRKLMLFSPIGIRVPPKGETW